MPLPDLLQWLCNAQVTGTLHVERERVSKFIHLAGGKIVGCSSNDPPQRLGHFLLSRGKITEEQLSEALHLQEISGQHLGALLVDLGALVPDEVSEHLVAQAEETVYSLFDWDDAAFRFEETDKEPPGVFPVGLRVEDVLLSGLKRYDEMREIREVFNDPGIVLEKTGKEVPASVLENRMGLSLWELVNGERTVAEILLQVHGSEYIVTKFLFELHRSAFVRIAKVQSIAETREPAAVGVSTEPATATAEAATTTDADELDEDVEDLLSDFEPGIDLPGDGRTVETGGGNGASADKSEPGKKEEDHTGTGMIAVEDSPEHRLKHDLEKARRLMVESEFEEALEILDALYRDHPGDEALRRLSAEAEAAFVEKAYRHYLPPSKVLFLTREADSLESEELSPSEFFLLSRIDGTWDIKSIIQIAPLRESDALRTLKRMRENGLVELREP